MMGLLVALAVFVAAVVPLSLPAAAAPGPPDAPGRQGGPGGQVTASEGTEVVAEGLANPRHVAVAPGGRVYVAESGRGGGTRVDVVMADGTGPICVGTTGAVTEVHRGRQRRLGGLPSWSGTDADGQCPGPGGFALGPHGVAVRGGDVTHTVGLGADPELRTAIADAFAPAGRLATAQRSKASPRARPLGDVGAFEADHDPDSTPDTNPYGMAAAEGGSRLVADAGGNSLVRLHPDGATSLVAQLPGTVPQSVPTGVAVGPDGAYYVGELRGFPFPLGGSRVWRVDPARAEPATCSQFDSVADGCEVYATGLTSVVDIDFGPDGRLYAVQLADEGVIALETGGSDEGSVQIVPPGGGAPVDAVEGLTAPGGVAVDGDQLYVTTHSVSPTDGRLVRVAAPAP